jgi:hypothetical protein
MGRFHEKRDRGGKGLFLFRAGDAGFDWAGPSQQLVQDTLLKEAICNRLAIEFETPVLELSFDLFHTFLANIRGAPEHVKGLPRGVCQGRVLEAFLRGRSPVLTPLGPLFEPLSSLSESLPQEIHFYHFSAPGS